MNKGRTLGLLVAISTLLFARQSHLAAATMGTAFTYQGRFLDGGGAADDPYDFELKLYDALTAGTQQGSTVYKADVDVNDGYFTVALDFGSSVFDGDARWLEIGIRPGESTGAYTTLAPRHELTPGAYALYSEQTKGITVADGNVGIGTTSPGLPLTTVGDDADPASSGATATGAVQIQQATNDVVLEMGVKANSDRYAWLQSANKTYHNYTYALALNPNGGNVGIGTTSPSKTLTVNGTAEVLGSSSESGALFMHGSQHYLGLRSCTPATGKLPLSLQQQDSTGISFTFYINASSDVGIGTTSPAEKLDVNGNIRCVDLTETSDEQLKTDVQSLSGVLDKLDRLRGISFQWSEKAQAMGIRADRRQIGVLAQELEQVFPELVTTPKPITLDELLKHYPEETQTAELRQQLEKDAERSNYKAVSYSKLTAVLLEAVKELKAENRSLEQRIQALESKAQ